MREPAPLANEYRQLERLAKRLGREVNEGDQSRQLDGGSATSAVRPRRNAASSRAVSNAASSSSGRRQAAASRASKRNSRSSTTMPKPGTSRRPGRREDILRLVKQRPGITVRELGTELGVDPTGVYKPVRSLEHDGRVIKRGNQLRLPDTAAQGHRRRGGPRCAADDAALPSWRIRVFAVGTRKPSVLAVAFQSRGAQETMTSLSSVRVSFLSPDGVASGHEPVYLICRRPKS